MKKSLQMTVTLSVLSLALILPRSLSAQETIELVNPSFEEPGSEQRDFTMIPGWSTDGATQDSGVGQNALATDGEWVCWSMSNDPSVWQLSNYEIQDGDVITLLADVRNSWQTNTFDLILYYDDNGTRVAAATTTHDFEGIVDGFLTEFSVTLDAATVPDAVGHLVGVEVDNTSADNSFIEFDNVRLSRATATAIEDETGLPDAFALDQNYPNPFNPETVIPYRLSSAGRVDLNVFDVLGHKVTTLVSSELPAGSYSVPWNGLDDTGVRVPSGVYVYRITVDGTGSAAESSASRTMLLLK